MSRILILQPPPHDECRQALSTCGHELVVCADQEALFDALAERRPDALVYVLTDPNVDLRVLLLLRRITPSLPIILLGADAGLEARRSVQVLNPTYYGVFPLDPSELSEAVRCALDHRGRSRGNPGHGVEAEPVTPPRPGSLEGPERRTASSSSGIAPPHPRS
jgi:DNA-binding response OmpR family regulator